MKSPLTDEQANDIADQIAQTGMNVYQVAEKLLSRPLTDEENDAVYEHVEAQGIFKCSECDMWRSTSERSGERDDMCVECEEEE